MPKPGGQSDPHSQSLCPGLNVKPAQRKLNNTYVWDNSHFFNLSLQYNEFCQMFSSSTQIGLGSATRQGKQSFCISLITKANRQKVLTWNLIRKLKAFHWRGSVFKKFRGGREGQMLYNGT